MTLFVQLLMGSNPKTFTNQQTSSASTSIGGPVALLVVLRVSQSLISVGFDSADFAILIACNLTARSHHAAEPVKRIQKAYDAIVGRLKTVHTF